MSPPTAAVRLRVREMLAEAERLDRDLAALIGQLTQFTDELQAELKAQRVDRSGGDHGPAAEGGLAH